MAFSNLQKNMRNDKNQQGKANINGEKESNPIEAKLRTLKQYKKSYVKTKTQMFQLVFAYKCFTVFTEFRESLSTLYYC